MFASKLSISQETLKKNELSSTQRNIEYWKRIKELDASGELQKIKSRQQLMESMGAMPEDTKAYAFVSNRIQKNNLKEVIVGLEDGRRVYEYHLTNKYPRFDPDFKGRRKPNRKKQTIMKNPEPIKAKETKMADISENYVTLAKGDVTIKIPMSAKNFEKLVLMLWRGEI